MKELSKCKCNLKATANNYTEFEEEQKLLGKMINHNLSLKTKWTIIAKKQKLDELITTWICTNEYN